MNSNWVTMKPNNAPQPNKSDLVRKILDVIQWYEDNATRKEDDFIIAKLKSIILLAENVENSEDLIYIEDMLDILLDIIKRQRHVIRELEDEQGSVAFNAQGLNQYGFMSSCVAPIEEATRDEQIKSVFMAYMKKKDKSPFTTNDYILRIQNLWRSFYSDYEAGELPSELAESVIRDEIDTDCPLLNAYNCIEELNCYVSMKIAGDSTNRNWFNIRAALNIFGEAMHGDDYKKVKVVSSSAPSKDFSKYYFDGHTYGKSRLVLAVVTRYVKENRPTNFDELEKIFPSHLQGSLGVVRRMEDVSDKYKGIGGVKRYFINADEVLHLTSGEQVIVCTQFGATNTEQFIEHVTNLLGYQIRKV